MLRTKRIRDQKGAAITGLVIALMFFILMAGLFAFDASRVQMAQRELTATCDAAALAGTAMLTSYDVSNDNGPSPPAGQKLLNAQNNSGAYAFNMFLMGNILGRELRPTTQLVTSVAALNTTTDGDCKVIVSLVDPQNNFANVPPVTPQNANGTAIGVYAGYGYHPVFICFFGVGNVGILAKSVGGLPQVDAVLVLDFSGSMDDLTPVTLMKRYWDAHRGTVNLPGWGTIIERPIASGYNGGPVDTMGWSDAAGTVYPIINQNAFAGTATTPYDPLNKDMVPQSDFGGVPPFSNPFTTASSSDGRPDFPEYSGHGCVTYVPANKANVNQSLLEYVALDTGTYLTGTSLNVLPPQNLSFSDKGTLLSSPASLVFKPFLRYDGNQNDYNSTPGNCPAFQVSGTPMPNHVVPGPICQFGWRLGATPPPSWGLTGPPFSNNTTRCSPYSSAISDHLTYPTSAAPASGLIANDYNTHNTIYTDLVVNFGQPTNGQKPQQPAWGPNVFQAVTYTFPSSDEDAQISGQTFSFANLAVLVEASRGNLDRAANFNFTGLHRGYDLAPTNIHPSIADPGYHPPGSLNMTVKAGTQRAYQRLAMWHSQPIATCLDACDQAFFQRLAALTDCRFGLVGFSDNWTIGAAPNPSSVSSANTGVFGSTAYYTSSGPSANSYYWDISYQPVRDAILGNRTWDGRLGLSDNSCIAKHECQVNQANGGGAGLGFRIPRFPLNTALTKAQCLRTMQKGDPTATYHWSNPDHGDGLYNGRPLNGTMCSEALETARLEFQNAPYVGSQRPGSKRAIIFFTDGVPVPTSEEAPSRTSASACNNNGVAIFCIGLNMLGNATLTQQQTTFLGNGANGLSGLAKNGGRFFMCNDVTQVQQAFSSIARRLTQSQK